MIKHRHIQILTLLVFIGWGLLLYPALAHAKIMFMPSHAVFQDRQRSADILVVNTNDKPSTFRLGWIHQYQTEDNGRYEREDASRDQNYDVTKMVLFSPKQVTLEPGGRQRIRLSLRRPADLPEGEYHAHLKLQSLNAADIPDVGPPPTGESQAKMAIGMNVSFAIPVIVRQGAYKASVAISDPTFIPSDQGRPPKLRITLNRSGTHGTMGSVKVFWTPAGGQEKQVGLANNVNIFTELTKRISDINLSEQQIVGGSMRVIYEGIGPDKGIKYDEKIFPIGG